MQTSRAIKKRRDDNLLTGWEPAPDQAPSIMRDLHLRYPEYGFARHKGYSTPAHMRALGAHGPCPEHRLTFQPVLPRRALRALRGVAAAELDD